MANRLYISCYRYLAHDDTGKQIPVPQEPALEHMTLEITHEPQLSPAFPQYTHFVEIKADCDCSIAIGADPTADQEFNKVDAGERLTRGVTAGHKLSVVEHLG